MCANYSSIYLADTNHLVSLFHPQAESRPSYTGTRMWPKKSEINRRTFTEEQLKMGESVINLQMGTNRFANQSGMTFGKKRMITKD